MYLRYFFDHFEKLYICFRKPFALLMALFSLEQNQFYSKRMCRVISDSVNYISGRRYISYNLVTH